MAVRREHPRTVAVLAWLFGDLSQVNGIRLVTAVLAFSLVGMAIGAATVIFLPIWVTLVLLALSVAGLFWMLKVLADLGWPSPWQ